MKDQAPPGEFRILSHGMLGYGFPAASLARAVEAGIDLIAVDAGSTDPGPYYLGSGAPFGARAMVLRDLQMLVEAQEATGAPIVIGSAGGAGGNPQVDWLLEVLREVLRRLGVRKRVAVVRSEMDRSLLHAALDAGHIRTFETGAALTHADIDAACRIVAQIGPEPIIAALAERPDIVLCGRAWDVANVAALPVALGFPRGLAFHLGKILECGGQAALPVEGSDLLMGRLSADGFVVESPHARKICTVESIAAHTLYEKTNPVNLPGPGGTVDLTRARFEQIDPARVRVEGSAYHPAPVYTVKLEGARLAGHRHIAIGGIRDPRMIGQIDRIEADMRDRLAQNLEGRIAPGTWLLTIRRYGLDGVMGALEPVKTPAHELGLLIDAVADTPEIAETVCAMARSLLLHWGYAGRIATAGNVAFPFSPADIPAGPVYAFNVYHLLELADPVAPFPFEMLEVA
ncbi:MAG: acyclic terpene utilization AtuA family protein [Rhodobacteraceae bacterium]|jgi:hypothetical protein|nr:acyclic terpene utilization AtuA family protein [Paracoccaceae bacterium]